MSDVFKTARLRAIAKDAYLEDFLRRAEQYQQGLLKQSELKPAKKRKQKPGTIYRQKDAVKPTH